jgi:hypothetical protein
MLKVFLLFIVLLFTVSALCCGQTTYEQFHSDVQALYSFHPSKLSEQEREAKSAEMDKFWNKIESDKNGYIPLLREELTDLTNPPFFLFDGSQLLLKISKEKSDKLVCLRAIAHCDLNDVQHSHYLFTVQSLAKDGLNTTEAALHILDYPGFKVFIPQHALTLAQNYCFLYMLLPTDELFYVDSCIAQLKVQKNDTSIQTLTMLLWYTVTKEGDRSIENISSDPSISQSSKNYAHEFQGANDKILQNAIALQSNSSYDELKQARKKVMSRISDEALYELDELTMKIRFAYNKIK